jgi:hypothetical protein
MPRSKKAPGNSKLRHGAFTRCSADSD